MTTNELALTWSSDAMTQASARRKSIDDAARQIHTAKSKEEARVAAIRHCPEGPVLEHLEALRVPRKILEALGT